jgi:hypothetical protein
VFKIISGLEISYFKVSNYKPTSSDLFPQREENNCDDIALPRASQLQAKKTVRDLFATDPKIPQINTKCLGKY